MSTYLARSGKRFEPMPGRVLVRPDEGPAQVGGVFLCDSARRFAGYRSGEVLAVGAPVLDGERVDVPDVGEVVHYERNRPPPHCDHGVQLGEETLVLLWADQVLCREVVECDACGQEDRGQTGEYPCPTCGVPRTWDAPEVPA